PTLRERTSTSSAAMLGTSRSRTAALRGSSKTSAFIRMLASSLVDQDLDLIGSPRRESFERVGRLIEFDVTGYDTLHREIPRGNLRCHPVEVVDPVTPGPDDRQVVQRPKHGLNRRLFHKQAGLG